MNSSSGLLEEELLDPQARHDYADPIAAISAWEAGFLSHVGITQVSA